MLNINQALSVCVYIRQHDRPFCIYFKNSHHGSIIIFQMFPDAKLETQVEFLTLPSKHQVRTLVEASLGSVKASGKPSGGTDEQTTKSVLQELDGEEETRAHRLSEVSGGSGSGDTTNGLKRKCDQSDQPLSKTMKMSLNELDVYLTEPLEKNSSLLYWKAATRYPQLQRIAKMLLAVPATCGGFDRLFPMAAWIAKARRSHMPPHTTERLLLYKNSSKIVKRPRGVTKRK